jgi:hypothetical protein
MRNEPVCYQVTAFPLDMHPEAGTLDEQWIPFFAGLEKPIRVISRTTRFDLRGPRQQMLNLLRPLDAAASGYALIAEAVERWDAKTPERLAHLAATLAPPLREALDAALPAQRRRDRAAWQQALAKLGRPLWRRRWLQEYSRYYQLLTEQVELRGLEHFMLCWLPDGVRPTQQAAVITRSFGTPARIDELPPLLLDLYDEGGDCLIPREPHLPYIALLAADDLRGTWSLWTLSRLLDLDLDLRLCIDVVPLDRTKGEMMVDFIAVSTDNALQDPNARRDKKLQRKNQTADYFLEQAEQGFHELRVVVAVEGRDKETLDGAVRQVITSSGSFLRFVRPPHGQGPLAQFFTTTPTSRIDAFVNTRVEIGHGAAVSMPFGIRRPSRTDGLLWIIEGQTPIMFNPMRDAADRKRAGHTVVLGKTGSGKTFSAFVWASRMLALGWQVVFFEPQGHARRLIRACGHGGAYYKLDMRQRINVLDVAVTRDDEGNPPELARQNMHVMNQLAILLGSHNPSADGESTFTARSFTTIERALLDHALQKLYAPWAADLDKLTPAETPTLADFCAILESMPVRPSTEAVRTGLLDELYLYLVSGSAGAVYNGKTSVAWDFSHDATAYDLTALDAGTPRVLYTAQAFGALNRYVRNRPDRDRPLIVFFDEFAFTLGQAPALARFAADAAKTWRTFCAALITMDQDAHTYLGTEGAVASGPLRSVFDNATLKIIFQQDPNPAERLGEVVDGLQPQHVQAIKGAGLGDCVLAWNSDDNARQISEVFSGRVVPTDAELRAYSGT